MARLLPASKPVTHCNLRRPRASLSLLWEWWGVRGAKAGVEEIWKWEQVWVWLKAGISLIGDLKGLWEATYFFLCTLEAITDS